MSNCFEYVSLCPLCPQRTLRFLFGPDRLEEKTKKPRRETLNIKNLEFPREYLKEKEEVNMAIDLKAAEEKAKKIKLIILDVHGVLTTNDVIYDGQGSRYRVFNHEDGFGANALMACGVEIAVITRKSKATENRMNDIGIKRFYQTKEKVGKYLELLEELNISEEEVSFIGDEIIDMGVMKRVGFAVAPCDGKPDVLKISDFISEKAGGRGVLREVAEFVLKAQGKWDGFCEKIMNKGW